jgi:hypothetical protein
MDRGWVSISFWVQVDGKFFYGAVVGLIVGLCCIAAMGLILRLSTVMGLRVGSLMVWI